MNGLAKLQSLESLGLSATEGEGLSQLDQIEARADPCWRVPDGSVRIGGRVETRGRFGRPGSLTTWPPYVTAARPGDPGRHLEG